MSADLTLRPFTPADIGAVLALWRDAGIRLGPTDTPAELIRTFQHAPELFLAAHDGTDLVGAVIGAWDGRRGWIYHLAVVPGRQREGIGARLLTEVETRLRARGCAKVNLLIEPDNADVIRFYERLGYRADSLVFMEKWLAPAASTTASVAAHPIDVLVISGPAGVGKSSVAFEVSLQLQGSGIDHALIDTDELDRLYPVPADLADLSEEGLTAMWSGFARRGARRLILVGVYLDRASQQSWIARAVPGARFTLVRLTAPDATIAQRVTRREVGSGRADQQERSLRQSEAMAGDTRPGVAAIATDGLEVPDIARHIIGMWQPVA